MAGSGIGIIGGTGQLGRAIAASWLNSGAVQPEELWLVNRSGTAPGFEHYPEINVTTDRDAMLAACDTVLLCLPPDAARGMKAIAPDRLVLSVMAGIGRDELTRLSASPRVVRAMSSPAAERHLAYSPWIATAAVTEADRACVTRLLGACGLTDEIEDEDQIDHFTAMTGPVPGFVAFFAAAMTDHAIRMGIAPEIADRAMRQLFLGSGQMLSRDTRSAQEHVDEMIAYAGTTAEGLRSLQGSPLAEALSTALGAAAAKAARIGRNEG
ncbi:pyrroline-5-carboxylate reductase family protein [Pseudoponticoccus marisrubri]|uniref:Pyrroline-5-carboxylate reductase n=1 Tax=Pseudoponticoccus marisrubri TaxID=1685382 RepID=A0A0W7WP05_9RHOB|nr:pyrroline-5-carboxylate reductase dimerization domain-containing protein [Pseudoponticoccus marisrubri]KUF12247.1 pyrroline-5-carboxylate reductase [Pseudoponticoccus marisrubri]